MGTSIKTIAKKCNVSIATVSRVINNSGYVSKENHRLIKEAIKELNYTPNKIASNLRKKNSSTIGLIVPDIANDFFSSLALTIENKLQKNNFSLFLCNTQENIEKEKFYIQSLLENKVEAIILTSSNLGAINQLLSNIQVPVLLIDRYENAPGNDNIISVVSDNTNGAMLAGKYLIDRGADKILYLRDTKNIEPEWHRENGISRVVKETSVNKKIEFQIHKTIGDSRNARENIKKIFQNYSFNGVFCSNDIIALGALKGLTDLNIKVPREVQLIGFDGLKLGEYFTPSLTTIYQDIQKMGEMATEMVIRMIRHEQIVDKHITIPTKLIKRETTR